MIEGYPFTEMYSLNWESFNILRTFVDTIKCLRGVSLRSLTKMWLRALESILPANDGMHGGDPYTEEAGQNKGVGIFTNPFHAALNGQDDDQNIRDNNQQPLNGDIQGQSPRNPHDRPAQVKENHHKQNGSFFSLFTQSSFKTLFSRDTVAKVVY